MDHCGQASAASAENEGFTLVEILIAVAIIGIIAAIAIPVMSRARISANEAAAIGDLRAVLSTARGINCASPNPNFMTTKSGYDRGCTPGSSYWLTPQVPGKTGVRGFAGDAYGRICSTPDGTVPTMPNCTTLR